MPLPLRFWKPRRATPAARRTSPRSPTCFRPQVEALETRLVPAMVPLTVTIPRLEMLDDTDPDFIFIDRPDYCAIVTTDGVEQPMSSVVSGVNITPNWSFTQNVDNHKARIPVV